MCNRLRDLIYSEGNGDKIATLNLHFQIVRNIPDPWKIDMFGKR